MTFCFFSSKGGTTSMPMLAAVPATILMADSTVVQFKSGNFSVAISRSCSIVTLPTFSSCGSFEPFSAPARKIVKKSKAPESNPNVGFEM
jgi:hypothetical protein